LEKAQKLAAATGRPVQTVVPADVKPTMTYQEAMRETTNLMKELQEAIEATNKQVTTMHSKYRMLEAMMMQVKRTSTSTPTWTPALSPVTSARETTELPQHESQIVENSASQIVGHPSANGGASSLTTANLQKFEDMLDH
jgi:hypothetical protein